ncbi:Na+/H+ antiporter NhaA [Lacibacterium aquatile]|uniref:Na(+)/H(+) antiporter NhaA n=1 Tax=Lacibacterium aquatile TaxID=1168082 RepID=A0ABW5DQS1_9PROT
MKRFFKSEVAGGVFLLMASILALVASNSGMADLYGHFLSVPFAIRLGDAGLEKPLLLWINDGLMAVFFFLVGLEIKREALFGRLASFQKLALPLAAAVGGMAVPGLIYAAINWGDPAALNGWAIPTATDIAFAMGVLAVLGKRVPTGVRIFLLALAIIDDLGAILVIAFFYTSDLSTVALGLAGAALVFLVLLNRLGVRTFTPYLLVGLFLWVCVLKSGVHATLAGVAVAMAIPSRNKEGKIEGGMLTQIEHSLQPYVAFGVLPIFAFANAGVSFSGMSFASLFQPVTLGILLGLVVGKPIGVFIGAYLAVKVRLAALPEATDWKQILAAGMMAGIGFTMSLFIGGLALQGAEAQAWIRLGVLSASVIAAIAGGGMLAVLARKTP